MADYADATADAWDDTAACALVAVVIYMHTMLAWLTVQMLWQMHGRTLQAVHMLIFCMGIKC